MRLWIISILSIVSCTNGPAKDQRPVILISIDSLRADHCTPYGYQAEFTTEETTPWMQELAKDGLTFEECSAAAPWTLPSHISMLTAMHPMEHGVRARRFRLPDNTENIAGKFKEAGYQTAAFYSAPFLHPSWGYYPGFDTYASAAPYLNTEEATDAIMDTTSQGIRKFHDAADTDKENAPHVVNKALEWLQEEDRKNRPFFMFLHFWDPHYNYQAPDNYNEIFLPDFSGNDRKLGKEFTPRLPQEYSTDQISRIKAMYDAEIRYTDDQISRFFKKLRDWGLEDKVIVAVLSDHGDHFGEHGHYYHHRTLYEEVIHVPFVIKANGIIKPSTRSKASVSIYDVSPTLLDLAGLKAWPERSGRSALNLPENSSGHEVLMDLLHPGQQLDLRGWRQGFNKAIWDTRGGTFGVWDLSSDPQEKKPHWIGDPEQTDLSSKASAAFRKAEESVGSAAPMSEDETMKQRLAELGYTDG